MNAARHARFPRCKPLGQGDLPTLCAFTSEDVNNIYHFNTLKYDNSNI